MPSIPVQTDISSIDGLLDLHDAAFVDAAYLALLQRPADADGAAFYLLQLRRGGAREQVILELADSPEARARPAFDAAGIEALRARSGPPAGLWPRAMRRLLRPWLEPLTTQGRRTENAVFRLLGQQAAFDARIEARMVERSAAAAGAAPDAAAVTAQHICRMKHFIEAPVR